MPELFDLYDAERKPLGRVMERGTRVPQGTYHLVISAWIRNSRGEFLMSRRHPDKPYGLYWECTGGAVVAGEDSLTGAVREVGEELGLTVSPDEGQLILSEHHADAFYDVWLFHSDAPIESLNLQACEVVDAAWMPREQIAELNAQGALVPSLRYFFTLPALA